MARLQRRSELLREQIADQRDTPVAQSDALIEQRECGLSVALAARALRQTGCGDACRRHVSEVTRSESGERSMGAPLASPYDISGSAASSIILTK